MKPINSIEELRNERKRLRLVLKETETLIREDFDWAIESLKPINIITRSISRVVEYRKGNFLSEGVVNALGYLTGKVLFRNSSWITKFIVAKIVKNISSNLIGDHEADLRSTLKNVIHKLRTKGHKENGFYDSSTAQTHY